MDDKIIYSIFRRSFELLRHLEAEYGVWNESKQKYELSVDEAIKLAEEILSEEQYDLEYK